MVHTPTSNMGGGVGLRILDVLSASFTVVGYILTPDFNQLIKDVIDRIRWLSLDQLIN